MQQSYTFITERTSTDAAELHLHHRAHVHWCSRAAPSPHHACPL